MILSDRILDTLFRGSELVQQIQCLKLPRNSLGNKGIETLFSSIRLRHIRRLDISSNNIVGEEGGRIIAKSQAFPQLVSMDLRLNRLGAEGFRALVQTKEYPCLTDLKVDKNKLQDEGAQQLVQICNLMELQVLKLRANDIEVKGAQFIANSYAVR